MTEDQRGPHSFEAQKWVSWEPGVFREMMWQIPTRTHLEASLCWETPGGDVDSLASARSLLTTAPEPHQLAGSEHAGKDCRCLILKKELGERWSQFEKCLMVSLMPTVASSSGLKYSSVKLTRGACPA